MTSKVAVHRLLCHKLGISRSELELAGPMSVTASLVYSFYLTLSVAAYQIVYADPSLRHTLLLTQARENKTEQNIGTYAKY